MVHLFFFGSFWVQRGIGLVEIPEGADITQSRFLWSYGVVRDLCLTCV
jgi:hypothetical protein